MTLQWTDIRQSESGVRRITHWFEARAGTLRISVGDDHIWYRGTGKWLMHCAPWFDTYVLTATNEADAKREAISLVSAKVTETAIALGIIAVGDA